MPRTRPPRELWNSLRRITWRRDHKRCVRCGRELKLREAHIDHIRSGRLATNGLQNLRTLCRRCHVLRADPRHRGMIAGALRDEIIPPNWRELIWEG
jgi:5-methylcytosine-specific restriction endonuclease McrA